MKVTANNKESRPPPERHAVDGRRKPAAMVREGIDGSRKPLANLRQGFDGSRKALENLREGIDRCRKLPATWKWLLIAVESFSQTCGKELIVVDGFPRLENGH